MNPEVHRDLWRGPWGVIQTHLLLMSLWAGSGCYDLVQLSFELKDVDFAASLSTFSNNWPHLMGKRFVNIQLELPLLHLVSVACCTILPPVLLLGTYKQVSLSTLQPTIRLLKAVKRSSLSVFLLLRLNKPSSSAPPCPCVRKPSSGPMLVASCWTCSSFSVSFFYQRSQNWT